TIHGGGAPHFARRSPVLEVFHCHTNLSDGRTACSVQLIEQAPTLQKAGGSRPEEVRRHRVAWEGRAIENQHTTPKPRQQHSERGPCDPAANDDRVPHNTLIKSTIVLFMRVRPCYFVNGIT